MSRGENRMSQAVKIRVHFLVCLRPPEQVLWASRDVMISSQIYVSMRRSDGCWPPIKFIHHKLNHKLQIFLRNDIAARATLSVLGPQGQILHGVT